MRKLNKVVGENVLLKLLVSVRGTRRSDIQRRLSLNEIY